MDHKGFLTFLSGKTGEDLAMLLIYFQVHFLQGPSQSATSPLVSKYLGCKDHISYLFHL